MKITKLLTGLLIASLVACAPESRKPNVRPMDKVPSNIDLKAAQIAEQARRELREKNGAVKSHGLEGAINSQILSDVQAILVEKNDKKEIEKIIVSTTNNIKGLVLLRSAKNQAMYTNEADSSASEKYRVYVTKSEGSKTEIIVGDINKRGSVEGSVTQINQPVKAAALSNNADKIWIKTESILKEASYELTTKIKALEKQFSGDLLLSTLVLKVVDEASKATEKSVTRQYLQIGKLIVSTERYLNEDLKVSVEGEKLQSGTVKSIETKVAYQTTIEIEIDKATVMIVLKSEDTDAQRAEELKKIADEYVEWAETHN